MKDFQSVVQDLLHNHERHRRYVALLTVLCLLMSFTVSMILIEPAESQTGELYCTEIEHVHSEDCFALVCGQEETEGHVHSEACSRLSCGLNEHVHSLNCYVATMALNDGIALYADNGVPEGTFSDWDAKKEGSFDMAEGIISVTGVPQGPITDGNTPRDVKFTMSYHVPAPQPSLTYPYVYYQLDPELVRVLNYQSGPVYDAGYTDADGNSISGYYEITENGLIKIRFTDAYLKAKASDIRQNGLDGKISFNASVSRREGNDGDQDVSFGEGEDKTVTVPFLSNDIDISKDGYLEENPNGSEQNGNAYTGNINWNITVSDSTESRSLSGYQLRDAAFKNFAKFDGDNFIGVEGIDIAAHYQDDNSTVDPSALGHWEYDAGSGEVYFQFNDNLLTRQKVVEFTYTTEVSDHTTNGNAGYAQNTAYLKPPADSEDEQKQADKTVTFPNKVQITKNGTPDYALSGTEMNGEIEWEITLTSNYTNGSLDGLVIHDEKLDARIGDYQITPSGVTLEKQSDGTYIVKADPSVGKITIKYKTKAGKLSDGYYGESKINESWDGGYSRTPEIAENYNNASFDYQNSTPGGSDDAYVSYNPITVTKGGHLEHNKSPKQFKWTITISGNDGFSQLKETYTLEDIFPDGTLPSSLGEFTFKENNQDSNIKDRGILSYENGVLTIEATSNNPVDLPLTIEYYTPVPDWMEDGDSVSNGVTLSNGEGNIQHADGSAKYEERNEVHKSLVNDTADKTGVINSAEDYNVPLKQELHWYIDLTQDGGFGGKTATDKLTANSGGKHYISDEYEGPETVNDRTREAIERQDKRIVITAKRPGDTNATVIGSFTEPTWLSPKDGEDDTYENEYLTLHFTRNADNKIDGFTIEFKDKVDTDGFESVYVDYYSTIDLKDVKQGSTAEFKNDLNFNEKKASDKHPFENKDPNKPIYQKYIIDREGNRITDSDYERTLDQVPTDYFLDEVTGEMVECYVFSWIVEMEANMELTDILPEGFTLLVDETIKSDHSHHTDWKTGMTRTDIMDTLYSGGYFKYPFYAYSYNNDPLWPDANSSIAGSYLHTLENPSCPTYGANLFEVTDVENEDGKIRQKIHFAPADSAQHAAYFSAKIPVSVLNEKVGTQGYVISNSVSGVFSENGVDIEYAEQITSETVKRPKEHYVDKSSSRVTGQDGKVTYTVDFNPDGKTISNNGYVLLNDVLSVGMLIKPATDNTAEDKDLADLKKLSIILEDLKVYEVDVDGSKKPITDVEYLFDAKPGGTDADGNPIGATIQLTVPDGKHLSIEYKYFIQHSEINDLPKGTKLEVMNNISLSTRLGTSDSDSEKIDLVLKESESTSSTFGNPIVEKVNVSNYLMNGLDATFMLAKYDPEKGWIFAGLINETSNANNVSEHVVTKWYDEETDPVPTYPTLNDLTTDELINNNNLGRLVTDNDPETDYRIALESNTLYALLEVKAPSSRKDNNKYEYGQIGETPTIYYFTFDCENEYTSYPNGLDASQVDQIQLGGTISVPNNKLIDINVTKSWLPSTTVGKATVQLYWSYQKVLEGFPDEMYLVSNDPKDEGYIDGLPDDFKQNKEINGNTSTKWEDLPNGHNGRPIYYYVREYSYTIGNKQYLYDEATGRYVFTQNDPNIPNGEGDSEEGDWLPTYTNNGVSNDGTVGIANNKQLRVRKVWHNSDGSTMNTPPLTGIKFKIWGVVTGANGRETLYTLKSAKGAEEFTLSTSNSWTMYFDNADLRAYDAAGNLMEHEDGTPWTLADFESFTVEEIVAENDVPKMSSFEVSYTQNVVDGKGTVSIINKDTIPEKFEVIVNKVWSDGNENHSNDTVTLQLYQSKIKHDPYPTGKTEDMTAHGKAVVIGKDQDWTHKWSDLPNRDKDQTPWYYYVLETGTTATGHDYEVRYESTADTTVAKSKIVTVTNVIPDSLRVKKVWVDQNGNEFTPGLDENGNLLEGTPASQVKVTLKLYRGEYDSADQIPSTTPEISSLNFVDDIELNAGNKWETVVENLPKLNEDQSKVYGYFIVEDPVDNGTLDKLHGDTSAGCQTNYDGNGQMSESLTPLVATNIIKLVPEFDFWVEKTWIDEKVQTGNGDEDNVLGRPSILSFTLTLYQKLGENGEWVVYDKTSPVEDENLYNKGVSSEGYRTYNYHFTDLPVQDANGTTYYYRVEETSIDGYVLQSWNANYIEGVSRGSEPDTTLGKPKIELTNVKSLNLKIEKNWSDGNAEHDVGEIEVRVYRKTGSQPDDKSKLALSVTPNPVNVLDGGWTEITVNRTGELTFVPDDPEIAVVEKEDGKIIVKGLQQGETWITVSDGVEEVRVQVFVRSLELVQDEGIYEVEAGKTLQLKARLYNENTGTFDYPESNPENGPKYSSESDAVEVDPVTGVVKGIKPGETATIKVTYEKDGQTLTAYCDVKVTYPDFKILVDGDDDVDTIKVGNATLTVDCEYGTYKYEIVSANPSGCATVTENGILTAASEGTVRVKATRNEDGKTAYVDLVIQAGESFSIKGNTGTWSSTYDLDSMETLISELKLTLDNDGLFDNDEMQIEVKFFDTVSNPGWHHWENLVVIKIKYNGSVFTCESTNQNVVADSDITIEGNVITIKFADDTLAGQINMFTYGGEWKGTFSLTATSTYTSLPTPTPIQAFNTFQPMAYALPEPVALEEGDYNWLVDEKGEYIILTINAKDDNWEKVLKNLPACDGGGQAYYYWVEETKCSNGYQARYNFYDNDNTTDTAINGMSPGYEPKAVVRNIRTQTDEDLGVEMPSTGGPGTMGYQAGGIAIIAGSLGWYGLRRLRSRRRKWVIPH